jgi:multidrug resistance efflux pump
MSSLSSRRCSISSLTYKDTKAKNNSFRIRSSLEQALISHQGSQNDRQKYQQYQNNVSNTIEKLNKNRKKLKLNRNNQNPQLFMISFVLIVYLIIQSEQGLNKFIFTNPK